MESQSQPFMDIFPRLSKRQGEKAAPKSIPYEAQSSGNKYDKCFQQPLTPPPNRPGRALDRIFCCLIKIMQYRHMTKRKKTMIWDYRIAFHWDTPGYHRESWLETQNLLEVSVTSKGWATHSKWLCQCESQSSPGRERNDDKGKRRWGFFKKNFIFHTTCLASSEYWAAGCQQLCQDLICLISTSPPEPGTQVGHPSYKRGTRNKKLSNLSGCEVAGSRA